MDQSMVKHPPVSKIAASYAFDVLQMRSNTPEGKTNVLIILTSRLYRIDVS